MRTITITVSGERAAGKTTLLLLIADFLKSCDITVKAHPQLESGVRHMLETGTLPPRPDELIFEVELLESFQ